jgi:hypothetical protein
MALAHCVLAWAKWRGLDDAGVDRATFDQAVRLMLAARWVMRASDRWWRQ